MKWRACCFCVFVRPSTVVDPLFLTDYLKLFLGLNPRFSSLFPCSLLFLTFSFFFWKHKRNAFHFVVIHLSSKLWQQNWKYNSRPITNSLIVAFNLYLEQLIIRQLLIVLWAQACLVVYVFHFNGFSFVTSALFSRQLIVYGFVVVFCSNKSWVMKCIYLGVQFTN